MQEPSLVRLLELETTGFRDSHISQGIDRSVRTKINLARQDAGQGTTLTMIIQVFLMNNKTFTI